MYATWCTKVEYKDDNLIVFAKNSSGYTFCKLNSDFSCIIEKTIKTDIIG